MKQELTSQLLHWRHSVPRRIVWRRQLPVFSPLSWRAMGSAARTLVGRRDPVPGAAVLLEEAFDARKAALFAAGTDALRWALTLAADGDGEAIVGAPAYSCFDVATAVVGADLPVALYDLDPATLAPDLDSLERVLRSGARMVVVSPLFGVPVDWESIAALAERYGAVAIEDAAQGDGASWRGRRLGSLGDLSVLSFGRGKGWTGGGGGALLLRSSWARGNGAPDPAVRIGASVAVACGALAQHALGRRGLYGLPATLPWLGLGQTAYHPPRPMRRMPRTSAALLRATHRIAGAEARVRRGNAEDLLRRIPFGKGIRRIATLPDGVPGYLRLPLRLSHGMEGFTSPRRAVRLGVTSGYPATLAGLPALRGRLVPAHREVPGAEALVRELVTLPTHSRLSVTERDELLRMLREYGGPCG